MQLGNWEIVKGGHIFTAYEVFMDIRDQTECIIFTTRHVLYQAECIIFTIRHESIN